MEFTRTIPATRQLHDENDNFVTLQAWKIEHLTGFGACFADGQDRWTHTATVTLYTDGIYGIARGNGPSRDCTRSLEAALACAKGLT